MKDIKDTITELLKTGLAHSIAQTFLIFSGILVGIAFWKQNTGVLLWIALWTLFYGMVAHYLTSLRKHESLGRYAVGNYFWQGVLFTTIFILYFLWWATGVSALLLCSMNLLFYVNIGTLILAAVLTIIWLFIMFCNKRKVEKDFGGFYEANYICKNCGSDEKKVNIPQKRPHWDHPCPQCGLYELEKKEEEKHPRQEIIISVKANNK